MMKKTNYAVKISQEVKEKVRNYCETKGIKQGHFVEEALKQKLEEEENLEDLLDLKRLKGQETQAIPLERYLKSRNVRS